MTVQGNAWEVKCFNETMRTIAAAEAAGDVEQLRDALDEMDGLWLHSVDMDMRDMCGVVFDRYDHFPLERGGTLSRQIAA